MNKSIVNTAIIFIVGIFSLNIDFVNAKEDEQLLIYHEMIENIRRYSFERDSTLPVDSINKALQEINYGRNGSAEQEELLQLSCNGDSEGFRRRHDRCSYRFGL